MCVCVCDVRVFCRFGVIHSVSTNLLLWANSVLNESKHQLNEHKERLITLGFGNITIGECARGRCALAHPGDLQTAQRPEDHRARLAQHRPDSPQPPESACWLREWGC